jgi:hypothetical protein
LLAEFYAAPAETLFGQDTLCAVLGCSPALAKQNRATNRGVPYSKIGGMIRYKKEDILNYIGDKRWSR